MSVKHDVLGFLRNPLEFAGIVSEQSRQLWLSALEEIALPLSTAAGRRLGAAQESAWRSLAASRLGLILGPPGTGKTFALSWMAVAYLMARRRAGLPCRVLLTGFTINSIGNLLEGVEEKARRYEPSAFPLLFCGSAPEEAFPDRVETFTINQREDQEAVWERLRQPHVVVGLTTWSLFRLLSESQEPGIEGPTLPLFDLVCIDEASQMMVAQGLMALAGLRADCRVLVAGDNQQLPPVQAIFDREINGRQLGSSLYEFLKTAKAPEVRFEETRRMNRPLAEFGSREFYEDRFYPAADIADKKLELKENWKEGLSDWQQIVLDPLYPVVILLHDGPAAGVENPFERVIVADIVRCFYERMLPFEQQGELTPEAFWRERMAVITPHRAQNAALRSHFSKKSWGVDCVVETVDRIQGKERDAIVAAYTVADTEFAQAEGEFLFSRNRLNVTTSRARRKLVFVVSRRLFEVVPPREEVIDAAQTLRRFVFGAERVEGVVLLPDTEGREWPVEVRVRRFEDGPLPPPLQGGVPSRGIQALPLLTESLQDIERIIRKIALVSKYGNAPHYEINRQALRDVAFAELRDLLILGRITLGQFGSPSFWAATPLDPPRQPYEIDSNTLRQRVTVVVEEVRQSNRSAPYWGIRNRFVWVSTDGDDRLRPYIDRYVQEGILEWVSDKSLALVEQARPTDEAEQSPPLELYDEDFALLNLLEDQEKKRINFGIFESWTTLRSLGLELGWDQISMAAAAERLRANGYVLIGDDDRCRSRMAELAREVRYVKQRFRVDDAHQRPYLVRSLKLATKDRNKPARDRSLNILVQRMKAGVIGEPSVGHALDLVSEMLRRAWHSSDPTLAGFQERAIEMIFSAWTGGEGRDSFVITADTGSGKTEAACLPILAGTAFDHLRGVRGTRALLVYPRIRLAHNQAQRLAYYLAHLATVPDAPPLTLGVQATGVPASFDRNIPPEWDPRGEGFTFPFFECPACGKGLLLTPERGVEGADRLSCNACGWSFAGWVGTQKRLAATPPAILLMVTESLHGWMQEPRYSRIFGDKGAPPRVVLADEIHLYALTHGANVGYALRRLLTRAHVNTADGRMPIAIGMSATLGRPDLVWGSLCGRTDVVQLAPLASERKANPKGREYFYFVQPEVESRGKDVAGASTTIQSLMVLAHGMRRRTGKEGGFRGLVFLDSIDKVRRLHGDYRDAEESKSLARYRTYFYGDDPGTGEPRTECCGQPWSCARFRDGECWYFASNDLRQVTARGPYRRDKHLHVGKWPVTSKGTERTAEMMRQSDIIFSTSSLEVGYDDPDMALVYQHYAPINLASFVQRKGRGGRGADDRPLTGITLSPYSPRDSWYFRRPEQMIDPAGFEIPLNMDNYFVRRGQAVACLLDGLARWKARNHDHSPVLQSGDAVALVAEAAEAADGFIREVLGPDIYSELAIANIAALWSMAYSARTGHIDFSSAPRYWGRLIPLMPRLLFQTINLPVLGVLVPGKPEPEQEDISLALTTVAPGNMTRRYSFEDFHWIVPQDGRSPWFAGPDHLVQEEELLHGNDTASFLREIPKAVRDAIGSEFHPMLSRPTQIHLELAGTRHGDWVPMWGYDRTQRRTVRLNGNQAGPIRIQEKSQATLRCFLVVQADREKATDQKWSLPATFGRLSSFVAAAGPAANQRMRAARLFWAADTTLKLEDRNRPEETLTQFFVHPGTRKPMFSGYSLETEGIQLHLDSATLDRFVGAEVERLRGGEEDRWLKGRLLGYFLRTKSSAAGLNVYHAIRLAEVLQSAAGKDDLREELRRLMRFWDGARLGSLLERTFEGMLSYHPLLTKKRIEALSEAVAGNLYKEVIQISCRDAGDTEFFSRYLRSLVLNGIAARLHQNFVLHGRGDEARVLAHTKIPLEFGSDASDTISVFENGMHGDGTTRTFLRHLEEVSETWTGGSLAECPSAQEDSLLERAVVLRERHPEWRELNPSQLSNVQRLAADLGVDGNRTPLDRVISVLFGSELVGDQRFELLDLHTEIRTVRERLRRQTRRVPTAWELVSAAVQLGINNSAETPQLAALNNAYAGLPDASSEESFSAASRVADQVYRLSASLCVDGCQACLHSAGGVADAVAGETAVSRLVLRSYSEFLFGSAATRS
jgi:hypothetical protein